MGLLDSGFGLAFKFTTQNAAAVSAASKSVDQLASSARKVEAQARISVGLYKDQATQLKSVIHNLKGKKLAAKAANDPARVKTLNMEIAKTRHELERVMMKQRERIGQAKTASREAVAAEKRIQAARAASMQQMAHMGQKMALVARGSMVAGAALSGASFMGASFLKKAVGEAVELEGAVKGVEIAVGGLTPKQIDKFKDSLMTLGIELPGTMKDMADAAAVLGKSGVAFEELEGATREAVSFAVAHGIQMTTASNMLVQTFNTFGKQFQDAGISMAMGMRQISSALTELAFAGPGTAEQLANITRRAGGAAAQLGLLPPQLMAFAAAARASGVTSQIAGTAFSKLFMAISSKAPEVAKALKLPAEEFFQMTKQDPVAAIRTVLQRLSDLKSEGSLQALEDSNALMKSLVGSGVRGAQGIGSLLTAFETNSTSVGEFNNKLEEFMVIGTRAAKTSDATTGKMEERAKTLSFQMEILSEEWQNFRLQIGEALAPLIALVVPIFTKIATWFKNLPKPVKTAIAFTILFGTAITGVTGAVLLLIGTFAMLASSTLINLQTLGIGFDDLTGAIKRAKIAAISFAKTNFLPGGIFRNLGRAIKGLWVYISTQKAAIKVQKALSMQTAIAAGKLLWKTIVTKSAAAKERIMAWWTAINTRLIKKDTRAIFLSALARKFHEKWTKRMTKENIKAFFSFANLKKAVKAVTLSPLKAGLGGLGKIFANVAVAGVGAFSVIAASMGAVIVGALVVVASLAAIAFVGYLMWRLFKVLFPETTESISEWVSGLGSFREALQSILDWIPIAGAIFELQFNKIAASITNPIMKAYEKVMSFLGKAAGALGMEGMAEKLNNQAKLLAQGSRLWKEELIKQERDVNKRIDQRLRNRVAESKKGLGAGIFASPLGKKGGVPVGTEGLGITPEEMKRLGISPADIADALGLGREQPARPVSPPPVVFTRGPAPTVPVSPPVVPTRAPARTQAQPLPPVDVNMSMMIEAHVDEGVLFTAMSREQTSVDLASGVAEGPTARGR